MFFFLLPWGHDHPVYDRPWLTYSLIALCTLVFLFTWSAERRAEMQIEAAVVHVEDVLEEYPDARVRLTVRGLPTRIEALLTPLVETKPDRVPDPGDGELELAVRELVAALNHLPAFAYGAQPGAPRIDRAFTHMFVHADVFHLLGNMLFLFVAGGVLECFWRRWAYVALYFASGLAGLAAHALASPGDFVPIVGASGAIAGLLGAFVIGYPKTRIKVAWFVWLFIHPLWGVWRVPAWVLIPLWAAIELASAAFSEGSGVAHWAHVGGFACGALVALIARQTNLVATDAGHAPTPPILVERRSLAPIRSIVPPAPLDLPLPPSRPARPTEIELPPPSDDDDLFER